MSWEEMKPVPGWVEVGPPGVKHALRSVVGGHLKEGWSGAFWDTLCGRRPRPGRRFVAVKWVHGTARGAGTMCLVSGRAEVFSVSVSTTNM